jgi:hypothetical protein
MDPLAGADGDLRGGVGAVDPRTSTINAKKRQWRPAWEVPELEIQ